MILSSRLRSKVVDFTQSGHQVPGNEINSASQVLFPIPASATEASSRCLTYGFLSIAGAHVVALAARYGPEAVVIGNINHPLSYPSIDTCAVFTRLRLPHHASGNFMVISILPLPFSGSANHVHRA